tara:strand:+ start:1438 stop:1650 length:213 start_codon:yes stop_codon:yes gene_type:complete
MSRERQEGNELRADWKDFIPFGVGLVNILRRTINLPITLRRRDIAYMEAVVIYQLGSLYAAWEGIEALAT